MADTPLERLDRLDELWLGYVLLLFGRGEGCSGGGGTGEGAGEGRDG